MPRKAKIGAAASRAPRTPAGPQGWAGVGCRPVTQEVLPSAMRHLGPSCLPRCDRLKLSPASSSKLLT